MGLKKTKNLPSSVTCEYWRVIQQNMNFDRLDCVVTVAGYKDKTARDAGATPLDSIQVSLDGDYHDEVYINGEDAMKNVSLKELYKVLKTKALAEAAKEENKDENLAFFADALDLK